MSKTTKDQQEIQGITDPVIDSVDAWEEVGVHTITCNTGTRVKVRIPDLADMIEGGELPSDLLDAALQAAGNQADDGEKKKVTVEDVRRDREFTHFLVSRALVQPQVTPDQVGRIPQPDKELIASIALRLREYDAEGTHIFGLDRSAKFRKFRLIGEFEPTVEGN